MMATKLSQSLFVCACLLLAGSESPAQERPPSLSFLVGQWQLQTSFALPDGKRMQGSAELDVVAILDGQGVRLEERHTPVAPGRPVFHETAIYALDPNSPQRIQGALLNSLGNRKLMEGEFRDGEWVITQTGKMFGGREGTNRLAWHAIDDTGFSLRMDRYDEPSGQWQLDQYSYVATRRPE